VDDVDQQGMPAREIDEGRRQPSPDQAPLRSVSRFPQGRARQKDPEPGEKREIVERGVTRAVDPERQEPVEPDGHALQGEREGRAHAEDGGSGGGTGRRLGSFEGQPVEEDRGPQAVEDPEVDGRGAVKDESHRSEQEDDEQGGKEILGREPGRGGASAFSPGSIPASRSTARSGPRPRSRPNGWGKKHQGAAALTWPSIVGIY